MLNDLLKRKTDIVERHMTLMANKQVEILKRMDNALPDEKKQFNFGLKLFDKLNTSFKFNKDKLLHMNGAERLQLGELWSRNAENLLNALNNDPGYKSLIGNFDEMIKYWQDEITQINKEISITEDKEKLQELKKRRKGAIEKK